MQQKTNQKFVSDLMSFSAYGAITEAFIIGAIEEKAAAVAAMRPEDLPQGAFVSPQLIINVAKEIKEKLDVRHGLQRAA